MAEASKGPLKVGLAGYGTVGSGLADVIEMNRDMIQRRTGREVKLATVADLGEDKRPAIEAKGATFTTDFNDFLNDPEIDVAVELMGGTTIAKTFIIKALEAGKHVVTANKALLAEHGNELFALAREKGLHLGFEASVAGGIPVVQTLKETLAGNRMHSIMGILNGTANFILTEMTETGMEFNEALKMAQDKGYAEADPTLDIEGMDSAHKLVLLIQLAFGQYYPLDKLEVVGVTVVTPMDIEFAREMGYRIKLIAQAHLVDDKIEAGVIPALIPESYLLAQVSGSFNAVRLYGNGGPIMLYGYGAGDLPTGSAVLADIMNVARDLAPYNTGFVETALPNAVILDLDEAVSPHYLRFMVPDRPGVLRDIGGVMADHGISLKQVVQKGEDTGKGVPIVFLTHEATAGAVHAAMRAVDELGLTKDRTMH
ncbi:MAG: homoserine dehydrogenase, partial [Desulfovibrio sp.]